VQKQPRRLLGSRELIKARHAGHRLPRAGVDFGARVGPLTAQNVQRLVEASWLPRSLSFRGSLLHFRRRVRSRSAPRARQVNVRARSELRAAVDVDRIAGDPARVVRGEERDRVGDIVGLREALERL
jgi:hypothetical protein